MTNKFVQWISNIFSTIPSKLKIFKEQHPEAQIIIADHTKARQFENEEEIQYEEKWILVKQDVLILTTESLFCGDWVIPLSIISKANLFKYHLGYVLKITTTDGIHYQFGLQKNLAWENQKTLPFILEEGEIKLSSFSLIIRIIIVTFLTYFIVQQYKLNNLGFNTIIYLLIIILLINPIIQYIRFYKVK